MGHSLALLHDHSVGASPGRNHHGGEGATSLNTFIVHDVLGVVLSNKTQRRLDQFKKMADSEANQRQFSLSPMHTIIYLLHGSIWLDHKTIGIFEAVRLYNTGLSSEIIAAGLLSVVS